MIRETSAETYKKVLESGLLSRRRAQVYAGLYRHGPCTINELYSRMNLTSENVQVNFHARMGELREMGAVREVRDRPCSVTGQTVIEWATTNDIPVPLKKVTRLRCPTCKGKGHLEQGRLL